jgi:hypothetical protein
MACTCKDAEGNPLNRCIGLCLVKDAIYTITDEQKREPLNGFAELILSQVDKMISERLNKFHLNLDNDFQGEVFDAYNKGIKYGIELGKEFYYERQ